tara:strand:+ start:338 stop:1066 length:729 start_codon:yes stop_codon:yes gene_type:complete
MNEAQINDLSVTILEYYKDGEYAFNPDIPKQVKSHYNAKRACASVMEELFNNTSGTAVKYISVLCEMYKDMRPEEVKNWRDKYYDEKKKNQKNTDKLKLVEEGQDKSMCGICHYQVKEMVQKAKDEYVCENEDALLLTEKITRIKSRLRHSTDENHRLQTQLDDIRNNYAVCDKELWNEYLETKASDELSEKSSPKKGDNNSVLKKKYKKLKKRLFKAEAEIARLKSGLSEDSDSDSESESE